jgi:5-hydroxyisourate hydrolase
MPAKISTQVLDAAHGCPANGMKIELWAITRDDRVLVTTARTNAEGRTEQPLLSADEMKPGLYEIVFHAGDYFTAKGTVLPKIRFLDQIPVRLGIADAGACYHVPLVCSPWSYSLFRG